MATDIKIGDDDQTKIDFETADEIHFYAANVEQVYVADNIFGPQSDSDVDLGTTGARWKDAYIDTITTTGQTTIGTNLYIGAAGSQSGFIGIYGGSSGEGGELRLYMADDHDSSYDFWRLDVATDGLRIGRAGNTDINIDASGAVDLGSNTLTSTGSMQIRTIDYSDGDLAMTIADVGGVTFAQDMQTAKIELGHASDTTVERSASGTVTIEGSIITTVGSQDMWVPASAMRPSSTNGCAEIDDIETTSGRPDLQVLDFDTSSDEFAQFSVGFPQSWNAGTVTFQAYWTSSGTNTGTVAWAMAGVCCGDNDTIDVAYGTPVVATAKAHSGTVEDLNVSAESGAVTITNAAKGELVFFTIFRDVSADDNTGDARLIGVKITYTTDAATD